MQEDPSVKPLALLVYAAYSLGYTFFDYQVLKRDKLSGSAKANTLYRAWSFALPDRHVFNAAAAEVSTLVLNVAGATPI